MSHLVGADNHALDLGKPVQRGDCHERNDGGAVGVGHDAPLALCHALQRIRVDLRNHQGNALCHPEGRAVVNNLHASQDISCAREQCIRLILFASFHAFHMLLVLLFRWIAASHMLLALL